MSAEVELLLATAAWDSNPARAERVRRGASRVEWERWLVLTHAHGLVPHARRQLASAGVAPPPAIATELETVSRESAMRGLALVRERDALVAAFAGAGVRALPFKGPSLALAAYGDASARASIDLDFVVTERDMPRALEALRGAGYVSRHGMTPAQERAIQTSFGHFEYSKPGAVAHVEMHTMFSSPRYPWTMPVDDVLGRASWTGAGVPVIDRVDDLVLQAAHGARHQWERLEWLVAFAAVLERSQVDSGALISRAERHHTARALRVALRTADLLLGAKVSSELLQWVSKDRSAEELARELVAMVHRGEPARGLDSPTRFDLRQLDGTADRVRYLMRSVFDPTLREWEVVKLPDALLPLYYPVRLARLALRPFVRR